MHNGYIRKFGVAAIASAVVTMAAWKAPQASSMLTAASNPTVATVATSVPGAVTSASYAPMLEHVMPAVVTVRVQKRAAMIPTADQQIPEEFRRFFGDQLPQRGQRQPRPLQRGLGSGVIASQDGYILTNNHVVEGVDDVKVELPDNRTFSAKVVGTDPATDLAVVKIDATNLPTLVFGDSDAVKVGDVALAIGNPLNVGQTVTSGIISAKGRQTPDGRDSYQDFLQTDAAINHGNSGGALVNAGGQLIGINSQILSPSDGNIGLGFAIPSNMAKQVMDQLIANGAVRRARLGVTVQGITADMAAALGLPSAQGALISSVDPGSPAARAGIKQGDVITHYNGKAVADNNQLRNAVASTMPGTSVPVQLLRDGKSTTLQTTVGELTTAKGRVDEPSAATGRGKYGMSVQPLTPEIAENVGVPRGTPGVIVSDVDPAGIAADSGLQEWDVIEKANGTLVKSGEDLKASLERRDGKPSLLLVHRRDATIFLTLAAR
ncbi:MAG TPA: DegQ family serine endoprotease [Vicinamibacterales bacterium]|nr:DegQ family serine endoprotease [Vicinamibacterales bacterium]